MSDTIKSKCCSHCKKIKPVSEFSRNKSKKDGYQKQCKKCLREYCRKYYQKHQVEQLEDSKKYYQSHRVERLQYGEKYRKVHRTKYLKYHKKYYQTHRTERLQSVKKYYSTIQGYLQRLWNRMLQRCNNPKHSNYKYYGGRGIQVKFACFDYFYNYVVKELKADPRGLTIDRINNDGHYEPGNIRFVTQAENLKNRRSKYQTKLS